MVIHDYIPLSFIMELHSIITEIIIFVKNKKRLIQKMNNSNNYIVTVNIELAKVNAKNGSL